MSPTIACVVPCHNEETAVGTVVRDLRAALPEAEIYVYDNRSTDRTAEVAREAGATVRRELRKGKGNVIRRAFADIDADALVLIDGDDTYEAARAREMVDLLFEGPYDQVLGVRHQIGDGAYRTGHAAREPAAHRSGPCPVRPRGDRHAQRLPGLLPALREVASRPCPTSSRPRPR